MVVQRRIACVLGLWSLLAFLSIPGGALFVAAQPAVVQGTILGHDDEPLPLAHAGLHAAGLNRSPFQLAQAGPAGSFQMAVDTTGVFTLWLTGVHHHGSSLAVYLQPGDTLAVRARLRTYRYTDDFSDLRAIGSFNDFQFRDGTVAFTQRADRTYAATVPAPGDSVAYQLINAQASRRRSINGPMADRYVYDRGGDYQSVVAAPSDSVTIVFDPSAVVEDRQTSSQVTIEEAAPAMRIFTVFNNRLHDAFSAGRSRAAGDSARQHWHRTVRRGETVDEQHPILFRAMNRTAPDDSLFRAFLFVRYVDFFEDEIEDLAASDAQVLGTWMRANVAPSSPAWAAEPDALWTVTQFANRSDAKAYLTAIIDRHPEVGVEATARGAMTRLDLSRLQRSRVWSESQGYDATVRRYNRAYQLGHPIPSVDLASLRDTSVTYTPRIAAGRYTLIATWTSWCASCRETLAEMRPVYERHRPRFSILTIALDHALDRARSAVESDRLPGLHTTVFGRDRETLKQNLDRGDGEASYLLLNPAGYIIYQSTRLAPQDLDALLDALLQD